ncbi:hypothetical protein DUNSADRAFT_3421 [Dunaliella salina]|uniref:Encoded protein n=1 Tax=Dunaliella salina TaxID=3046 RepID=A0ABQ7FVE5_DUNSA|nr:hypothetical protein DUNSADRAFT_3421 [Dunaliella salina]|eukprot:KAF5826359.1 hypothetical protein DUNSADRAFT_3421 [Dunaliella salina]
MIHKKTFLVLMPEIPHGFWSAIKKRSHYAPTGSQAGTSWDKLGLGSLLSVTEEPQAEERRQQGTRGLAV